MEIAFGAIHVVHANQGDDKPIPGALVVLAKDVGFHDGFPRLGRVGENVRGIDNSPYGKAESAVKLWRRDGVIIEHSVVDVDGGVGVAHDVDEGNFLDSRQIRNNGKRSQITNIVWVTGTLTRYGCGGWQNVGVVPIFTQ